VGKGGAERGRPGANRLQKRGTKPLPLPGQTAWGSSGMEGNNKKRKSWAREKRRKEYPAPFQIARLKNFRRNYTDKEGKSPGRGPVERGTYPRTISRGRQNRLGKEK